MSTSAKLVLADGTIYAGTTYAATGSVFGQLVFDTTMTGYQHSLTNPSNAATIMVFTFPHIGNVGVNAGDAESEHYWPGGVVVRDPARIRSNWQAERDLNEVLTEANVVGVASVDTRALTRHIAAMGQVTAGIFAGEDAADSDETLIAKVRDWTQPTAATLVDTVSTHKTYAVEADNAQATVALIDLGVRQATINQLVERGNTVQVMPASTTAADIAAAGVDGVVLSSGPGNPADLADHIGLAQALLNAKTPLLGIGLGHQLIGLALGFETYLLPQAQRGPNQPVYDVASGQSLITSQNHAYALQAEQGTHAAPHADYGQVTVTQYSLNDNSVESLELTDLPVVTVQYYPENSALETDEPHTVFDRFATLMATGE
ncbi:MAG: carbamoyl phosphate synthase small subunit [Yaniella sp.]|uniref:carbamoyl phosphate synthase small subunit n=1 Tax=Yaniella sp. TaxID=2773929 RepID=UPI00264947A3|nr:carbamoyl phosphate synthase small subunit [Yaniella sp.]MDN5730571.1 carbamoyl phosphate synthase small subunit [Yaniella sp.]MDN5815811.1 carbamoyl phosphate synthase small subunit [Yaniella sp.]MDN5817080.1 carbamoyl phosphate synthase small subunit [Yaniella sp.]MDN5837550.1 carbamoyl phosphate synthase small subunit [Yaniella sp.]MDN5889046.1 carbamoyl phosphate synthase small subunit [Yaniella sp.]